MKEKRGSMTTESIHQIIFIEKATTIITSEWKLNCKYVIM